MVSVITGLNPSSAGRRRPGLAFGSPLAGPPTPPPPLLLPVPPAPQPPQIPAPSQLPAPPQPPQLPASRCMENPHGWRASSFQAAGTPGCPEVPVTAEEQQLAPQRSPRGSLLEQCNSNLSFAIPRFCQESFNCTRQLKKMFKNKQS